MLAVIDKRAPIEAINRLEKDFEVICFISEGITYDAICGHPDIFLFQHKNTLILAPNTPSYFCKELKKRNIKFTFGEKPVGKDLHNSSQYNCFIKGNSLIHRKNFTDKSILKSYPDSQLIEIPQSYSRCSAIDLGKFILTSDMGIYQNLTKIGIPVEYVSAKGIRLPPYPNGFIGGCCGILDNTIYMIGSPDHFPDKNLKKIIELSELKIEYLYDGSLYDGGGIFFI